MLKCPCEQLKAPPITQKALGLLPLTDLSMQGWWSRFMSCTSLSMLARLLLSLFIFRAITWSEARWWTWKNSQKTLPFNSTVSIDKNKQRVLWRATTTRVKFFFIYKLNEEWNEVRLTDWNRADIAEVENQFCNIVVHCDLIVPSDCVKAEASPSISPWSAGANPSMHTHKHICVYILYIYIYTYCMYRHTIIQH